MTTVEPVPLNQEERERAAACSRFVVFYQGREYLVYVRYTMPRTATEILAHCAVQHSYGTRYHWRKLSLYRPSKLVKAVAAIAERYAAGLHPAEAGATCKPLI